MAFQAFGSILLAEDLLEDSLGILSRAWERDAKGGIHPLFVRRFSPRLNVPAVLDALQRSVGALELPPACGSGHQFGLSPRPYWKLHHRQSRSIRRLQSRCREDGFPFGLQQALNIAWNLAHTCAHFWRRGLSVGPLDPDSIRVDFEGGLFLPDLAWMPALIGLADAQPAVRIALPDLPRSPGEDGLGDEARRFGALLYELVTFEPLPAGLPAEKAIATARVWTPDGSEPLPKALRDGLARLLDAGGRPFETLEGAMKDLEALVFDGEDGPSTFNLAHLIHTLFRLEYDRQKDQFAQELEILQSNVHWGSDRPAAGELPEIPIRRKSTRGLLVGGTLLVAGLGTALLLLVRDQERSRRSLEEELARLQTDYALQVQQGADAASLERHQERLKEDLRKLAQNASSTEERALVGQEIAKLPIVPRSKEPQVPILPPATAPNAVDPAGPGNRPLPVSPRPEVPTSGLSPQAARSPVPQAPLPLPPGPVPTLAAQDRPPHVLALQHFTWPRGTARTALSLRVFIHEDGRPLRAVPVPGGTAAPEVIQVAIEAAMKSSYAPAQRGGKPARDWLQVQFNP